MPATTITVPFTTERLAVLRGWTRRVSGDGAVGYQLHHGTPSERLRGERANTILFDEEMGSPWEAQAGGITRQDLRDALRLLPDLPTELVQGQVSVFVRQDYFVDARSGRRMHANSGGTLEYDEP